MSTGEESASYSDAQDNSSNGGINVSDDSGGEVTGPHPKSKAPLRTLSLMRSESLFLALLFALIALLLPTFFSFAAPPNADATGERESPLRALLPYIPTLTTCLQFSFMALKLVTRPFLAILYLLLALFAPVFLAVNLLYKAFVLVPSRIAVEVLRFLYPIYVFCGVACLFGAGIGLSGRLVVEGSKLIFLQDNATKAGKRSIRDL